jgi:DNA mismatch repair protein MutS
MLQQYFRIREEHPGVLLAMRVGDFYEFYGEDAETAATALEITLTGREDGDNGRVAMAGVPFHSVEKYLARLLQKGIKVALCEQLEDPKAAKGLVKRGVTRVITPGTLMEDSMLQASSNNFLAAICRVGDRAGLAILDPSTGEFNVTEIHGEGIEDRLLSELARSKPAELLVAAELEPLGAVATAGLGTLVTGAKAPSQDRAARVLQDQFSVRNLQGFGLEALDAAVTAASMVIQYATQNGLSLAHVSGVTTYSVEGFMQLDLATRRSLELTQNMADSSRRFTLLSVLDETITPMGSRLIRRWIEQPLLDGAAIAARHEAVGRLVNQAAVRADLRTGLKRVADLERLVSRAAAGFANPRDLAALKSSLQAMPTLAEPLRKVGMGRIQELREQITDHGDLALLLEKALIADPPMNLREGGIIKPGHDLELDKLREIGQNGKVYIAELEQKERQRTGVSTLKVGFNSVFGYYLEVSKLHQDKVPSEYIRKQTTANAERYITAELKDHESAVLGAEEKAFALEADLFVRLRSRVAEHAASLIQTARAFAEIDVLCALAETAVRRNYVKPELVDGNVLMIEGGRHPVVEANNSLFVPNDVDLDDQARVIILTGPNMSGKSTFLRQNALIVLMAQIGSFVPASRATLSMCDRIFARIGAKDELALGQSTFMVEMVESANILNHSTENSLVILDEVGRGTSTYDGLAIAWAMVEYLVETGAKTLFATHYHQLNILAEQHSEVKNFRVSVEELGDDIIWTHRVLPGGTDRSYGIHVARMAGVPPVVLLRAAEILENLEQTSGAPTPATTKRLQLTLFEVEEPQVVKELAGMDLNRLTPIEALRILDDWKKKFAVK